MLREHFSLGAGFPRLAIHHTVGRPDSLSNRSVVRRATRIVCRRALCGGSAKLAPKLKYTLYCLGDIGVTKQYEGIQVKRPRRRLFAVLNHYDAIALAGRFDAGISKHMLYYLSA